MNNLFQIQSSLSQKPEDINRLTKPSFPQHQQISQTIFVCVPNHHTTRDNQSHSNREIIDIEDEEEEDEEDENTCKNGTSIDDSSDQEEIEVIQLSDDKEDEVNDENMIATSNKHKINELHNVCEMVSIDLTRNTISSIQRHRSTDFEHPPGQPVQKQSLPSQVKDHNKNETPSRDRILKTLGLTCTECYQLIETQSKLNQHLMELHVGNLSFRCMIRGCNGQFTKRSLLDKHYLNHCLVPSTKWICSALNCKSEHSIKASFMFHVHQYHEKGLFQCAVCLVQYSHRSMVYNHYKAKHRYAQERANIRFWCTWPHCGSIFSFFSKAITHVRTEHLPVLAQEAAQRNVRCYRVASEFIQKIQLIDQAQEPRNE